MISGAPLSATAIAGARIAGVSSGPQTLTPSAVTATWTVPAQAAIGTGSISVTANAVSVSWTVPAQSVTTSGSIALAPPAVAVSWTVPSQRIGIAVYVRRGIMQRSGSRTKPKISPG